MKKILNKAGYAGIGIVVAIAIIGLVFGLNYAPDSDSVDIPPTSTPPESEPSETESEEGISHQISLSDKATGKENP